MEFAIEYVLIPFIKILVVFLVVSGVVAYLTLAERKVAAFIQVRLGPMRVGPYGILQPLADGIKLMLKEDIVPAGADKWIFTLAPVISLVPAFIVFAGPNGMTANTMNAGTSEMTGANVKIHLSAPAGTMSSFNMSFRPSASGCKMP